MANQYDTVQYEIGDVFEDMEIIDKESTIDSRGKKGIKYVLRCTKCGRIKKKRRSSLTKLEGTSHRGCCEQIRPKDENYKRFQSIWSGMRTRTTNPNQQSWEHYHDVSSEHYKYFIDFYDDMFASYVEHVKEHGASNTTLDRIDPNGDYEPNNIRWATRKVQNQPKNKRGFKRYIGISPDGEKYVFDNIREFCGEHNLNRCKVSSLLNKKISYYKGWSFEREE